jgi:hypothetical protein
LSEVIFALGIDPYIGFQDRRTGETVVSTKRGFEPLTPWRGATDIQ